MKINICHKAFSLPEILLTLTIIGVISAMTIPSLKDHSDEVATVSQVKKAYSDISAATSAVETKYGDLQFWPWDDQNAIMNRYATQLMFNESQGKTRTTQNGYTWSFSNGEVHTGSKYNIGGIAVVDVNTDMNPPNQPGVDIFAFRISRDGVVPMGAPSVQESSSFDDTYTVVKEGKVPKFH